MNSFERVVSTIMRIEVDRPPVFAVLGAYGKKYVDSSMQEIFSSPEAYIASQLKIIEEFGFDMALGPFDFSVLGEAFGGQTVYFDGQPPNVRKPVIKAAEDFVSLTEPVIKKAGRLPFVLDAISGLNKRLSNEIPVFGVIPGPGSLPALIMGLESWIETWLFMPELRKMILEKSREFLTKWAAALIEAGAAGLIMVEGVATSEVLTRNSIEKELLPVWNNFLPEINSAVFFHHSGGKLTHILDLLAPIDEIIGVCIGAGDSIVEARELLGPNKTIIGNIDNLKLPFWSEEKILRKSMECLAEGVANGPFILANSGGDISLNTPEANIRAMVQASREYKKNQPRLEETHAR